MGCKHSKGAVDGASATNTEDAVVSKNKNKHTPTSTNNKNSKKKKPMIGIEKPHNNKNNNKNNSATNPKGHNTNKATVKSFRNIGSIHKGNNNNNNSNKSTSLTSIPVGTHETLPEDGVSLSMKGTRSNDQDEFKSTNSTNRVLYKMLTEIINDNSSSSNSNSTSNSNNKKQTQQHSTLDAIIRMISASSASYRCPRTRSTPLHLAVRLLDHEMSSSSSSSSSVHAAQSNHSSSTSSSTNNNNNNKNASVIGLVDELIRAYPLSVTTEDMNGNIPLHYAIAPTVYPNQRVLQAKGSWKTRTAVVRLLLAADQQKLRTMTMTTSEGATTASTSTTGSSKTSSSATKSIQYLKRNDVVFIPHTRARRQYSTDDDDDDDDDNDNNNVSDNNNEPGSVGIDLNNDNGGCSPLYRAIQTLPDDFSTNSATLDYIHLLLKAIVGIVDKNSSTTSSSSSTYQNHIRGTDVVCKGNASDGDKPLALLYRRFTRQFDLAEKFFSGDNSRIEVVEHRKNYKQAAGNTWKIIELILQYQEQPYDVVSRQNYKTIHRAVQGETPPDLLRYIVETNAEDLTIPDESGNLPLHHAAKARPPSAVLQKSKQQQQQQQQNGTTTSTSNKDITVVTTDYKASFPAFYSKYVIDELLYKYPEAASIQDSAGFYPLTLAVKSGKQWIGGGIKSLYDAYPDAIEQIDLNDHLALKIALSADINNKSDEECYNDDNDNENNNNDNDISNTAKEEKTASAADLIRDELHDAIMLVQQDNVDISEVVASMWAHEEDAGVQMLGCVAIARLVRAATQRTLDSEFNTNTTTTATTAGSHNTTMNKVGTSTPRSSHSSNLGSTLDDVMRIALCAVPAVVNAMKAHPNEIIVQEKACLALKGMAWSDGKREISFVASGAVAAIIGAMQAHVSDQGVQEEACGAIGRIIRYGGPDRATVVASVSGLTAIINAIAAHPTSCGVQKDGCRALRELTEYPNANLPDIPRSQTESLLETAKHNFPNECSDIVDVLMSRLS